MWIIWTCMIRTKYQHPKIDWFRLTRQHDRVPDRPDRRDLRIRRIDRNIQVSRTASITGVSVCIHPPWHTCTNPISSKLSKIPKYSCFRLPSQYNRHPYRPDRRNLHIRGVNIYLEASRTALTTEIQDLVHTLLDIWKYTFLNQISKYP